MKPLWFSAFTCLLCLGLLLPAACRQAAPKQGSHVFREDFERGTKPGYAAGEVELRSGTWLLDGALLGSTDADARAGAASLRLAPGGKAEMRFDLETLPDTLSFSFAPFGGRGEASVSVWYSNDAGRSWSKFPTQQRHAGAGFATAEVMRGRGYRAPIRFRVRNDGRERVNIDDFGAGAIGEPAGFRAGAGQPGGGGTRRPSGQAAAVNLLLGNPDGAAPDAASETRYLVERPQYTLSYNNERGTANWVSWHLSRAEQGDAPRCNCFSADAALPETFFRARSSDYVGSGFDRGHICPSDDRSGSPGDNAATFLMSNIAPQAPDLNQKCWKELEEYARRLTESGKELYIISGCYGEGGTGSKGAAKRIANGRITVPAHFWKIMLVLPDGNDDLTRIDAGTEIVAVDMPNTQAAGGYDWKSFRCTVASIERATGYRFFSALPEDVARALKMK